MILHLKGNGGRAIYEVDTNWVTTYQLPPSGGAIVHLADGRVIVIDRVEFDKLFDAMNAPR